MQSVNIQLNKLYQYVSNDGKTTIVDKLINAINRDGETMLYFKNGRCYLLEKGQLTLLIQ
jgi:hypothetical protein